MQPSKRTYINYHTGIVYRMYVNPDTHELKLIDEKTGQSISEFYAAAFNGIDYKFKDGSVITLNTGEFFTPFNTVGKPISKRFSGIQKRFNKI